MRINIPFVGPSYQARSIYANAERALNCYVELSPSDRSPIALYGTPGLRKVATLPSLGCRGAITVGNFFWVVYGNSVYRVNSSYVFALTGTIASSSGLVGIASNGTQILIVDGVRGYVVTISSNTLASITDVDFPNGVRQADYVDGYFLVTDNGTQQFYISDLLDGSSWDGTDFASAEGSPDSTVGLIVDHSEIWLFGSNSAEIWVNTGNPTFPFERSGNTFVEHGCIANKSIKKLDNTVFWLGGDDRGYGVVWRADGYTPQRVSNHALEHAISLYENVSDATAITYSQEGHAFYVLTFPTAEVTWVYDASTQLWHERAWRDPSTGELSRWRGVAHCLLNGKHLIGDCQDGRLYILDTEHYTDDLDPILRLRTTQTQAQMQTRLFYNWLQVDMQTGIGLTLGQGSDPMLMMRYSNNGGQSWSDYRNAPLGAIGDYDARCQYNRLGAGRNRTWEISMTDPVPFAVIGAVVDGDEGTN